jgi:hypothetical protein
MQKYLPSKKFIKFFLGVVAVVGVGVLVSFFVSNEETFKAERSDKEKVADSEFESIYKKDSDGDGVYDWEEGLWGTNPNNKDTNGDGVSDASDIENRKNIIKEENNFSAEFDSSDTTNQTEIFARQLLSTASLANQQGGLTDDSIESFSKSVSDSIENIAIEDQYTLTDLKLSSVSAFDYKKSLEKAFAPYRNSGISMTSVIYNFANGEPFAEQDLDKLIKIYANLSADLLKIQTPYAVAGTHLVMVNTAGKMSVVFANLKQLEQDPLMSVAGLKGYQKYSVEMENSIIRLTEYFRSSGV